VNFCTLQKRYTYCCCKAIRVTLCVKHTRGRHVVTSSTESYLILTDFRFSRCLIIDVNSAPGLLYHVVMSDVADVSELYTVSMKMVSACTSEASATSPRTTWCNDPRTEFTSISRSWKQIHAATKPVRQCKWAMLIYPRKIKRNTWACISIEDWHGQSTS
jgi:hypothetical protein